MPNIERLKKYNKIHMVGIGGVSMSGIAEILVNWGFKVTGSNNVENENTKKLEEAGIKVFIGHSADNVIGSDVVVYTAAIKDDNIELVTAKANNIPIIERADFLGEITRCYQDTITIAGTHGKSTTTSMVSLCFLNAKKDPTIQVGAMLKNIGGNYHIGNSDYCILEACEYKANFLYSFPKTEIILNIDNDHLDFFKTFDNVVKAFIDFSKILPNDGLLIVNSDDKNCLKLQNYAKSKFVTYGIENQDATYLAKNIEFDNNGFARFDVYKQNEFFFFF